MSVKQIRIKFWFYSQVITSIPVRVSEKDLVKKWLGRDIFKEAGLTDYSVKVPHLKPLRKQY